MWESVARGDVGAREGESTCPRHQPAVTAADFMALYDRCLASGLKACVVCSYIVGHQTLTVTCHLPVPAVTTAAAGKRRRLRRGRATTAGPDCRARVEPLNPAVPAIPSPTRTPLPLSSPEIASLPAKRTRKWRNELELLRDWQENDDLLVSPPPAEPRRHHSRRLLLRLPSLSLRPSLRPTRQLQHHQGH
jgi:hypothetical protein